MKMVLSIGSQENQLDQLPGFELSAQSQQSSIYSTIEPLDERGELSLISHLYQHLENTKSASIFIDLPFSSHHELENCVEDLAPLNGVYCCRSFKDRNQSNHVWERVGFVLMNNLPTELFQLAPTQKPPASAVHVIREAQMQHIQAFLDTTQTHHWILNLHAVSGMEKSQFLTHSLENTEHQFIEFKNHSSTDTEKWWQALIPQNASLPQAPESIALQISQIDSAPTIIVFDDFQWADEDSKRIIEILSNQPSANFKFIIISREKMEHIKCDHLEIPPMSYDEILRLTATTCPHLNHEESVLCARDIDALTKGHSILCAQLTRQITEDLSHSVPNIKRTQSLTLALLSKNQDSNYLSALPTLRILAQTSHPFSLEYIRSIQSHFNHAAASISEFNFIGYDEGAGTYSFQHALYRKAFLDDLTNSSTKIQTFIAKHFTGIGELYQASKHWFNAQNYKQAYSTLVTACQQAYQNHNLPLLKSAALKAEELGEKISVSPHEHSTIYWYLAYASMLAGSLETASLNAGKFLDAHLKPLRKRDSLNILKLAFQPDSPSKISNSLDQETIDNLCSAAFYTLEYAAFAENTLSILSKFVRFHSLSLRAHGQHQYRGISHSYLAVTVAPIASEKRVAGLFETARKLKNSSHSFAADAIDFLSIHYRSQLSDWKDAQPLLDALYTKSYRQQNFDIAAKSGMYKVLYLLELNQLEGALKFHQEHLTPLNVYLPSWIQSWISVVKFGLLFASNSHHKTLFHFSKNSINSELEAGSHVFYSAAYAYCENFQKAHHHLLIVIGKFHQMKIQHSAFTLALTAFLESSLILFAHGLINKKTAIKFQRAAKTHGKFVARSKGIVLGYNGIFKILLGNRNQGIAQLHRSLVISEKSSSSANSALIDAHLSCLGVHEFTSTDRTPAQQRVQSFWRIVTASQARPGS